MRLPPCHEGVATWLGLSNVMWAGMPQITTKSGFSGSGALSPLSFPSANMDSEVLVDDRASWCKESGSLDQPMEENHPMATNHALDCYMCRKQISIVLATVYGVTQSRTRLKWLKSSSNSMQPKLWDFLFPAASVTLTSPPPSSLPKSLIATFYLIMAIPCQALCKTHYTHCV